MFHLSGGLRVCVVAVIDVYEVALLHGGAAADGEAAQTASEAKILFINVCLSGGLRVLFV